MKKLSSVVCKSFSVVGSWRKIYRLGD